jgi:Flp pilus assembly protein TadB
MTAVAWMAIGFLALLAVLVAWALSFLNRSLDRFGQTLNAALDRFNAGVGAALDRFHVSTGGALDRVGKETGSLNNL